jgi:hypothetical protein
MAMQGLDLFFPAFFGTICFIIWMVLNAWQRRQQARQLGEFNTRLLQRIDSFKDFSEFIESAGGAKFLDRLMAGGPAQDVRSTILRTVQTGLVLLSLGTGMMVLAWILRFQYPYGDSYVFVICGVIALSLGVGFLLAGGASYKLAAGMRRNDG